MDFQAALFDIDGTLLDSMGVWARVDEAFFAGRSMAIPPDYATAISGMTFRETGEYTKARFALPESVDEILREWNGLCERAYRQEVPLKPGAKAYLEKLMRAGKKLAIATALPMRLYRPALERNGIFSYFSAFASTEETGRGKKTGEVYVLAAKRLGVSPEKCVVFEDIYEGLLGAKAVGMKAILVWDASAEHSLPKSRAICDAYLETFEEGAMEEAWI